MHSPVRGAVLERPQSCCEGPRDIQLAVISDYRFIRCRGEHYAEIPWDSRFIDLFAGRAARVVLVGRIESASDVPRNYYQVDSRYYKVLEMPPWKGNYGWAMVIPRLVKTLRDILRQSDAVVFKLFYVTSLVGFIVNRYGPKKPSAALLVGDSADALMARKDLLRSEPSRRIASTVVRWAIAKLLEQVDVPSTVSEHLRQKYAPKVMGVVVGNESWVDRTMFHTRQRNAWEKPKHVLFVGRLVPLKRPEVLLEAVIRLMDEGWPIDLTYVGDGPLRQDLEARAEIAGVRRRVHFAGWVRSQSSELFGYYRASDILCLPSLAEGMPLVLIEAMASSCAVIATRVGGVPELIEDGVSGLVIDSDRDEALYDGLRRYLDDPRLWRDCIENGLAVAEEQTFEKQRSRLALALLDAIQRRGTARPSG